MDCHSRAKPVPAKARGGNPARAIVRRCPPAPLLSSDNCGRWVPAFAGMTACVGVESPHRSRIGAREELHFGQEMPEMLGMMAAAAAQDAAARLRLFETRFVEHARDARIPFGTMRRRAVFRIEQLVDEAPHPFKAGDH